MIYQRTSSVLNGILFTIMLLYVVFRCFTTFVIMPFAMRYQDMTSTYFVVLSILAIIVTASAITPYRWLTASGAVVMVLAALSFWWIVVCKNDKPIWSDFRWDVVPEIVFVLAAGFRYLSNRSPQMEP